MDDLATNISKKCGACGQWSHATDAVDDRCEHCGAYLDPKGVEEQMNRVEKARKKMPWEDTVFIVNIKPTDIFPIRVGKRLIQFGQIIFMTIVSICLWIVAALAG